MIGAFRNYIPAIKVNETTTILPCVASDAVANVTLYKKRENHWEIFNETSSYSRFNGFILNEATPGEYRCYGNNVNLTDSDPQDNNDFVTVKLEAEVEQG